MEVVPVKAKRTLFVALLFVALANGAGCQDSLATKSEKTVYLSYRAANAFIIYEHNNSAVIKAKAPAIHAAAEKIRTEAPAIFLDADAAIAAYKDARTAPNETALTAATGKAADIGATATTELANAKALKP